MSTVESARLRAMLQDVRRTNKQLRQALQHIAELCDDAASHPNSFTMDQIREWTQLHLKYVGHASAPFKVLKGLKYKKGVGLVYRYKVV